MAGIFSLRNWVMKQLMKPNKQGIMTIPDKGKIDFGEMLLKEQLFQKGINPGAIKNEKQLDNILNTPVVSKSEKVKPKKSGEVIEVDFDKGRWNEAGDFNAADDVLVEQMYRTSGPRSLDEDKMYLAEFIAEDAGKVLDNLSTAEQNKFIKRAENALKRNIEQYRDKKAGGGRTGLSYLLAEDTNERVPFSKGKIVKKGLEGLAQLLKKEKARTQRISGDLRANNMQRTKIGKPKEGVDYDYYRELLDDDEVNVVMGDETEELLEAMVKEQEAEMAYMKRLYDKGALNPTAGETTRGRLKMLEDKAQSGEAISADETAEIKKLSEIFNKAQGGRIGFSKGKLADAARRKFMKTVGAGTAGLAALKTGALKLFGKEGATVAKEVTQVPIKDIDGMPEWFKPLVNKVIKEGDDVTKTHAYKDMQVVHKKRLGDPEDVYADDITVTQDLDTGNVRVEYDTVHNMGEAPIQLDYKAGEIIEEGSKKGTKTNPEFSAVESEPRVANWDGDIEWDGENVVGKVDDLLTDTTQLESYATGKKPTIKKLLKSEEKKKYVNKLNDDVMEQSDYIENKSGHLAPEDLMEAEDAAYHKSKEGLASGGRVPMFKGAMVPELDARAKINAALRAYKKYRRGEKNPRLKFKTFFEIYAGENFASGGLAGQLHLNQGGEAILHPETRSADRGLSNILRV